MAKEKSTVNVRSIDGYRDRMWVTMGRKVQVIDYEPVDISFGYASDQQKGETPDDTAKRVILTAQKYMKPLIKSLLDAKKRNG